MYTARRSTLCEPGSANTAEANHCLQVELNGGGAVISTPPCTISSQFSLALSLRVKTADLFYDGAWVELTLLDRGVEVWLIHKGRIVHGVNTASRSVIESEAVQHLQALHGGDDAEMRRTGRRVVA